MTANSPGVRIERRAVLHLPALAAIAGVSSVANAANAPAAADEDKSEAPLFFGAFTERCKLLAAEHLDGGRIDPDVYLARIAALGPRLNVNTLPEIELRDFGNYDPPVRTAPASMMPPIVVIQWRLAPGAVLPPHNHTPGYVYSLCLEGQCWVRHFEIVGEAPAPGAEGLFHMRKTMAKLLRPGMGSSLTHARDNIHTFTAGPEGAMGIDINTFLPEQGDWSMLKYEEGKREGFTKLYDANWIGKPGR